MASRSPFTCRKQSWPDGEVTAKLARGLALGVSKLPRKPHRAGGQGSSGKDAGNLSTQFCLEGQGSLCARGFALEFKEGWKPTEESTPAHGYTGRGPLKSASLSSQTAEVTRLSPV